MPAVGSDVAVTITKIFRFEAAHSLRYHEGKCHRVHGHSYVLHVTVTGPVNALTTSSCGMVMDFADLSAIVKPYVVGILDHQYINEVFPQLYPTAENLALWAWNAISDRLPREVRLRCVRLYETENSYAEVTAAGEATFDATLRS